jgi:hypothetical protein
MSEHRRHDRHRCPLHCPCSCELAHYQDLLGRKPALSVAEARALDRLIFDALRCFEANSPVPGLRRYAAQQLVNFRWDRGTKRGIWAP